MKKKKVIIIGAGPAGLTTAYELLKDNNDYDVTILEETGDIGGISKTVKFDGYRIDTGIHRFFSKDDRVNELWQKLLPIQGKASYEDIKLGIKKPLIKGGPDPEKDEKVFLIRNRLTRIYYMKKFFDYPVTLNKETIFNMGVKVTFISGFSYLKSCVIKKKEDSLENFYINRFGKKLYSMFFEDYTEKVWGRKPSLISADWGSQRVKGVSIRAVIKDALAKKFNKKNSSNTETSLIEQFYYPKLGSGQMWETLAEEVEKLGGRILTNHKVVQINFENMNITSVECESNKTKKIFKGDIFISSMPIKDLFEQLKGDKIPSNIYKIATGLPYRSFMTVGLVVDKINLKNVTNIPTLGNVVPDDWIYMQEPEVKMGRIQFFNNWSPYIFADKEKMDKEVFMALEYFCDENDKYWNMTDDEFIKFAVDEAIQIGVIDSKDQVMHSIRTKVKKAYPAYFDTYYEIDKVIKYLNSIDNLYCVGRNGQHRYNNMDHSMVTGMETASIIKNGINDKTVIWNVNTEKSYHEVKNNS